MPENRKTSESPANRTAASRSHCTEIFYTRIASFFTFRLRKIELLDDRVSSMIILDLKNMFARFDSTDQLWVLF